ncbi:MAG: KilA-N domain-containing protein [Myroides sp.]
MVTSVIMERKMGSFNVLQRTKDGYFDANELLNQWNSRSENKRKQILDFMNSKATKEFLQALNEEIAQSENSAMAFYEKNSVLTLF